MTLYFPDRATLQFLLVHGTLPAATVAAPAEAAVGEGGALTVAFAGKLPKKTLAELEKYGVTVASEHVGPTRTYQNWLELFPLERLPELPRVGSSVAVVFELPARDLAAYVHEMLRLGNDRQQVRWLDGGQTTALLRVFSPPFYTVLRAVESDAATCYTEAAPRVWVEFGYGYPLAEALKVPDDAGVFLASNRPWRTIPDAAFAELYDVMEFEVAAPERPLEEAPPPDPITVPLSLVEASQADPPELWVVRGESVAELDRFVRDADERLLAQLKFAAGTDAAGGSVVVLRATSAKSPPALSLPGVLGYRPFHKLAHLYVPVGRRLHPPLRRDAVRTLLADDPDRLVWLTPGDGGAFTPETITENAFRPLEDWVVYVVGANAEALDAWTEATTFAFEPFLCGENTKPAAPPPDRQSGARPGKTRPEPVVVEPPPMNPKVAQAQPGPKPPEVVPATPVVRPVSEWVRRRTELEREFLDAEGTIDAPVRQSLWPALAEANVGTDDLQEAAICHLNGLWHQPRPDQGVLADWATAELKSRPTLEALDGFLAMPTLALSDARRFAACALALLHAEPRPAGLESRLAGVKRQLEAHEAKLPVRAVWMLARQLALLAGNDALGLARSRDRLLQRLLEEGVRPERDLPFFLRGSAANDSGRLREARDQAAELYKVVHQWADASLGANSTSLRADDGATVAYIDLFFAFGFAKLGETGLARQLAESGRAVLTRHPESTERGIVGHFLAKAFTAKVEAALAGRPTNGPLDPALLAELDAIQDKAGYSTPSDNVYRSAHYAIMRMREQFRTLEQLEKLDPYSYLFNTDEFRAALNDLHRLRDPEVLARRVRDLYRMPLGNRATANTQFQVLLESLSLAGRVGEAFTLELLALVPETLKATTQLTVSYSDLAEDQGKLLDRAIYLAGNYDRRAEVERFVNLFLATAKATPEPKRYEFVNSAAPQCLRSLWRLGLRAETEQFLQQLQELVLGTQSLATLRQRYPQSQVAAWSKVMRCLLGIAGGWRMCGRVGEAEPTLALARTELMTPQGLTYQPKDFTALGQAYILALGHGPIEDGLAAIGGLFAAMAPSKITNSFTTALYYSRLHLNLVESVTTVLVSDDFSIGLAGRRWLDEDEFVVRRRVHADVRQAVAAS